MGINNGSTNSVDSGIDTYLSNSIVNGINLAGSGSGGPFYVPENGTDFYVTENGLNNYVPEI